MDDKSSLISQLQFIRSALDTLSAQVTDVLANAQGEDQPRRTAQDFQDQYHEPVLAEDGTPISPPPETTPLTEGETPPEQ